ncbi:MAG: hypothetical protein M3R08_01125 [Bacteroidota bacterium]|nr:hypothetical protein [Bacteroidota bacterium]
MLCILAATGNCFGQEEPVDTTETIYEKIDRFSEKRKLTRWIHSAIFVPPDTEEKPPAPALPARRVNPYTRYQGRIIRHIKIDVSDPFGYSVEDTSIHTTNGLQRMGNRLHAKTRPKIVRNLLLVRPFDKLDPLKITESERILRTSPAINDARITVLPVGLKKDSVDLIVRVLDRWTIDVGADGDLTTANARARERNLFGLGHELEQKLSFRFNEEFVELRGTHRVYNIGNSYVSSFASYYITETRDYVGLSLDRPFYSPLTRWAGGISANKEWIRSPYEYFNEEPIAFDRIDPINFDTWVARSFPLEKEGPESGRVSNLVIGTRLALTRYDRRPPEIRDQQGVFRHNTLFLAGIGLSQRQYYKERFLFRFGLTEDVPEGLLIRFLTGVQKRELLPTMPYLGGELARGRNYDKFGYLRYEISYGTFIGRQGIFDGTFRGGFTYFSQLASLGRWHVRQFVRFESVLGFSKPDYSRINLNGPNMYGFESPSLVGTHRTVLNFETVGYAPWDLIGFRIAPVLLMGFGILDQEEQPFLSGRVHSSFTLGILVRNERLLMNTFEVALSFFPFIPEEDGSLWKHNAFTNFNTGIRDFSFVSPHVISFN